MKFWKHKFLSLSIIALIALSGVVCASRVNAQALPSNILIDVVPPNPAPFENVTITLSSFANNLDSVLIRWSVNGANALSGIGKKSFSLNAPASGSQSIVVAIVSLPDGDVPTRVVISPSAMVLLWQANDSFVPPFYRGKALPTPESEVKVVAMPEVKIGASFVNPKNMTYTWQKDFNNLQDDSGYGKNFLLYTNDYLDGANNISVVASTVDQTFSSAANIDIGTTQPKIIFYKIDSILGTIWEQSLTNPHRIVGSEIVEAMPYFISPKELQNPLLSWSWFINDNLVNVLGVKNNVMPVQAQSGVTGTSRIRLQIDNRVKIFQSASKEMDIEF